MQRTIMMGIPLSALDAPWRGGPVPLCEEWPRRGGGDRPAHFIFHLSVP